MAEFHAAAQVMKMPSERDELIAELDRHRDQVADDLENLSDSLDFHQRFEDSVRRHPALWMGGSLAAGVILSRLLFPGGDRPGSEGSKKKARTKSSGFLGLLGIAGKEILRISTPILKEAAADQLELWMRKQNPGNRVDETSSEISNEESS